MNFVFVAVYLPAQHSWLRSTEALLLALGACFRQKAIVLQKAPRVRQSVIPEVRSGSGFQAETVCVASADRVGPCLWHVRAGQRCLCSEVLLLPLGDPRVPPTHPMPQVINEAAGGSSPIQTTPSAVSLGGFSLSLPPFVTVSVIPPATAGMTTAAAVPIGRGAMDMRQTHPTPTSHHQKWPGSGRIPAPLPCHRRRASHGVSPQPRGCGGGCSPPHLTWEMQHRARGLRITECYTSAPQGPGGGGGEGGGVGPKIVRHAQAQAQARHIPPVTRCAPACPPPPPPMCDISSRMGLCRLPPPGHAIAGAPPGDGAIRMGQTHHCLTKCVQACKLCTQDGIAHGSPRQIER